jgi:4-amino-4-deoxy-L-arabinose transferase-like glycosyltransferase
MKPIRWPWVLVLGFLPLLGWWATGLFDLDEGFYAAVAGEMNRRGEWITPFYNGRAWYEKPILTYWAMKPSIAVFGEMVGPRLPSVLATLGLYGLTGWFAFRRWGTRAAVLSVLVLSSSLLVVAVGRLAMTDALLVLFLSLAFLTFWESLVAKPWWRLVTAASLGFAVLAKGPVAILLFVPLAVYTFVAFRELRPRFAGYWSRGTVLLFLVVAAWYVPALFKDREVFVQEFLIEQNVGRFTGGDEAHTVRGLKGLVFYVPLFLAGFFPWSIVWIGKALGVRRSALGGKGDQVTGDQATGEEGSNHNDTTAQRHSQRSDGEAGKLGTESSELGAFGPNNEHPAPNAFGSPPNTQHLTPNTSLLPKFLSAWALIIFLFFSISSAKLPHYILPMAVPFSLLMGSWLAVGTRERAVRWSYFAAGWLVVVAVGVNVAQSWWYEESGHAEVHSLARFIREQGAESVAAYQMPRRPGAKVVLQETSHPSVVFYLDQKVLQTEELTKMLNAPKPLWVLTRVGRLKGEDVEAALREGYRLERVREGVKYEVWELR